MLWHLSSDLAWRSPDPRHSSRTTRLPDGDSGKYKDGPEIMQKLSDLRTEPSHAKLILPYVSECNDHVISSNISKNEDIVLSNRSECNRLHVNAESGLDPTPRICASKDDFL